MACQVNDSKDNCFIYIYVYFRWQTVINDFTISFLHFSVPGSPDSGRSKRSKYSDYEEEHLTYLRRQEEREKEKHKLEMEQLRLEVDGLRRSERQWLEWQQVQPPAVIQVSAPQLAAEGEVPNVGEGSSATTLTNLLNDLSYYI